MSNKKTAGIVCEYNPFHTGHQHQIDSLRCEGFDCIISAMSGNFTQRGELAIFDKYTRAEASVKSGIDIASELPFPYSSFSAEGFAKAGVHILYSMGADTLCFGSECCDEELLRKAANITASKEFTETYKESENTRGSAKAYFDTLSQFLGEDVKLLSNDILAISYIRAVNELGYDMNILPIKRQGSDYNSPALDTEKFPSATALRGYIAQGGELSSLGEGYISSSAKAVFQKAIEEQLGPVNISRIGNEILQFFRLMTPEEISSRAILRSRGGKGVLSDCGIVSRLCFCAKEALSFDEFINKAYTSRYTDGRINRVLLYSLFGVSDAFEHSLPFYTSVLAASKAGREQLSYLRKNGKMPIITKPADAPESPLTSILRSSDMLYTAAMPNSVFSDFFIKKQPYIEL